MYGKNGAGKAAPVTVNTLARMRRDGEPIACLTAYDASFAAALEAAGVDVLLVGDSLGMVVQGCSSTLSVTMDQMVYHCRAVSRGASRPLLVGDMPFLSFRDPETALINAGRLLSEGGVQMVKLEGAGASIAVTRRLTEAGIPVCGHLGLQPQSVNRLGGYRVQGRDAVQAGQLLDDARALEQAGADLLVLECVPDALARDVTKAIAIPTIGIGAGPGCSGQVLVLYDMLGLIGGKKPRFVRDFSAEGGSVAGAVAAYVQAVKQGSYPAPGESYG